MKVEGRNAVAELIKNSGNIDKILLQNGLRDNDSKQLIEKIKQLKIKVSYLDKSMMDKNSVTQKHQGFIGITADYKYFELEDIINNSLESNSLIVVLDGIEDPHNLGSIIRVAECAGVKGIIIGKNRSASVTETVMRISEGSANHIMIAKVTNINSAIEQLKKENIWVYAIELGGENLYQANLSGRLALVIGGEHTGVNKLTKQKCDGVLTIPMQGKVNSLNASVATGVAIFETKRQQNS